MSGRIATAIVLLILVGISGCNTTSNGMQHPPAQTTNGGNSGNSGGMGGGGGGY